MKKAAGDNAQVELVQIDVGDDASVAAAAAFVQSSLGGATLYALVNNAGTGLQHGVTAETVVNVNTLGPKRVTEAFLPLLNPEGGRIVNVGSGAGPMYVNDQPLATQKLLCDPAITWPQIEHLLQSGLAGDARGGYGVSKACLASYTMLLARTHPNLVCHCLTPGFIDTKIVAGWGATKPPSEGTVSLRHCLFEAGADTTGWFFGSDAERSPLYVLRNPGEPVFDGTLPW